MKRCTYSAPEKESREKFDFLNYKNIKKGFEMSLEIVIFSYIANTEAVHVQCRFW